MVRAKKLEMATDQELELLDGNGETVKELVESAMTQVNYRNRVEAKSEVRAAMIAEIRRRLNKRGGGFVEYDSIVWQ